LKTFGEHPTERFEDIGGNQTTVRELRHIVEDISRYQEGDESVRLPRGVLFYGPPGTGKTFNARVVCGEANCLMYYLNAGDLTSSPWLGSWVMAVNRAFEHARTARDQLTSKMQAAPEATGREWAVVVIFIDELDSLARRRSAEFTSESGGEHLRAINTFLAQLDGVDQKLNQGIIIMGATNHLKSIDPALLRPGRIGVQLKLSPPETAAERLDIIQKISKKALANRQMHLAEEAVLEDLSQITHSLSADHLRGIIERAMELAYRNHTDIVSIADVYEAYQETCFGHAHDSLLKEDDLVRVGAHEHGHGLNAIACKCHPLVVSMRPRGGSSGRIVINDHPLLEVIPTRVDLLRALLIAAGGRAGERVGAGPRGSSVGVEGDFARMEEIALEVFRSGLLGEEFAIHALNAKLAQLPASQQTLIAKLRQAALNAAEKIVRQLPPGVFDTLVRDSLRQNAELVGEDARTYYDGYIDKDTIAAMENIADVFIDDPFSFCTPPGDFEDVGLRQIPLAA